MEEESQVEEERKRKREREEIAWHPRDATKDLGPIEKLELLGMKKDVGQFDGQSGILGKWTL